MGLKQFDTSIHNAVRDAISVLLINDGGISDLSWDNRSSRVLACLVKEEIVPQEKLSELVHNRLIAAGRHCFQEHLNGQYADHTSSPAAFAYALRHGAFIHREEVLIKYDGETKETFIRQYERGIFEKVMSRLLTEKEPEKFPEFGDHCC